MSGENKKQKLCICCMSPIEDGVSKCPVCGYDGTQNNDPQYLPIGYRLHGRYIMGRVEDFDGEVATYISYDWKEACTVYIKEFLPENGCSRVEESMVVVPKNGAEKHFRSSLETFAEYYKKLSSIECQSLIEVSDCFLDNNTAYAVVKKFDGITLKEFLKLKNGTLTWKQCKMLIYPVMDAAKEMHKAGLIHRGISPETIFINRNGEIKLGGFATPAVRARGTEVSSRLYQGYSAPEQYSGLAQQGVFTDIYSISAVIYRCLTGIIPQDGESRRGLDTLLSVSELNASIPQYVSNAVSMGMVVQTEDRINSIDNLRRGLENEPIDNGTFIDLEDSARQWAEDAEAKDEEAEISEQERKTRNLVRIIMYITIGFFIILLIVYIAWSAVIRGSIKNTGSTSDDTSQSAVLIEVPSYIGESIDGTRFDGELFVFEIVMVDEPNTADGIVVAQSPDSGTEAEPGSTITLFVAGKTSDESSS
ncbi:MAG: protein kinase domain-containing protein [Oscillospiraceae bacterium]|jgi:serine/threonine protein kinase